MEGIKTLREKWKARRQEILKMNQEGYSYSYISKKFKVSYPRIQAIVKKARKESENGS
jgi:transposase